MSGEPYDLFVEPPLVLEAPALEAPLIVESLPAPPPLNGDAQPLLFADIAPPLAPPEPRPTIYVHFEKLSDVEGFARAIGQPVTTQTRYLRYPPEIDASSSWRATAILPPVVEEGEADVEDEGATPNLFGHGEWWEEHWRGMPEFVQEDLAPRHSIQVEFGKASDVGSFEKLLGQEIPNYTKRTPSIWYPEAEIGSFAGKRYEGPLSPRYPIYLPTKGRWETRFTIRALEAIGVPFRAVVEEHEFEKYAAVMDRTKILVQPSHNKGLVVTRNWIWDHALASGAKRFWTMDDNIQNFWRLNRNLKVPVADGTMLRVIEEFVERYENIPIAGMNYFMFASRKTKLAPYTPNTRVYSNMLIETDARDPRGKAYRNEGFYNDDTDLCLRVLKDGFCTILFNAFLIFKMTTMTVKGGMTPHYLANQGGENGKEADGRYKMAKELQEKHPDVTKITRKWGRWQHQVDYSAFKRNRLIPRAGVVVPGGVDDYGMDLVIRV